MKCMWVVNIILVQSMLTLQLPQVTKTEFLLTVSIQYQADK